MENMVNGILGNPLIKFLKHLLISFLICFSLFLGIFLYEETVNTISPPNPLINFNEKLVELYFNTEDNNFIHLLESEIDPFHLSEDSKKRYEARIWLNYLHHPEEYRDLSDFGFIKSYLLNHDEDYYNILINRSVYLTEKIEVNAPVLLTEEREGIMGLENILYRLSSSSAYAGDFIDEENDTRNYIKDRIRKIKENTQEAIEEEIEEGEGNKKIYIDEKLKEENLSIEEINSELYLRGILLIPNELEALEETVNFCNDVSKRQELAYNLLAPKYNLVVYDSFQRVKSNLLVEEATKILKDKSEDPLLRLLAADYLAMYWESHKLSSEIYILIEDFKQTNNFVNGNFSKEQELIFRRELITILRKTLIRESTPLSDDWFNQ